MDAFDRHLWSRFVTITKPLFTSEKRWRAYAGLAFLISLLLTLSGLNVLNSYVNRDFITAIAQRSPARFYWLALAYVGVFAASTLVGVLSQYTQDRLALFWRGWLTRYLSERYLSGQTYYRLNEREDIDNPDQRISQDVQTFTTTSLSFLVLILQSVITVLAFAGVLWSITPWLLLVACGYALFGSLTTILLGRRLVPLNNQQYKKEADLRYELIRTREYAEPIVQLGGEKQEKNRILSRLQKVVDNWRAIITVQRNVGFFTSGYNYLVQIIPVLIVAPRYLRGEVEFGVITQAMLAYSQVHNAFSLIVLQIQSISQFAAVVNRLGTLWDALTQPAAPAGPKIEVVDDDTRLAYERLTLRTPKEGRLLMRDLSVEVQRGNRLLIDGPNGAGKTALFRATSGMWEQGTGRIVRPHREQLIFLPQRPYLTLGCLRDQLLYGLPVNEVTNERLCAALRTVDFEAVLERVGGLEVDRDWSNLLSPGEQQLVAFARLLLMNPPFAMLDDALSALEPRRLRHLYEVLAGTSITYISVGDHALLSEYHDTFLEMHDDGSWKLEPLHVAAESGRR